MTLKSSIVVSPHIPWLRDGDEYQGYLLHCLDAIKAQQTTVKILPPKTTTVYSGKFDVGTPSRLYAIMDRMNAALEDSLKTDATHIWLLDADVEPPPHAVETLIRHDVDLASGVYPFHNFGLVSGRKPPCHAMMGRRMGDNECGVFRPRDWDYMKGQVFGENERVSAGTGCLLMKRRVLLQHHPRVKPLRFDKADGKCGADVYFWKRTQDMGFTARLDANVVCGHQPNYQLSKISEWLI